MLEDLGELFFKKYREENIYIDFFLILVKNDSSRIEKKIISMKKSTFHGFFCVIELIFDYVLQMYIN